MTIRIVLTFASHSMAAYFLYSVAVRPEVKENNPDASFGDIAKIISTQFKALPEKERAKWDAKAVADKERYQAEMEGKFCFDYRCLLVLHSIVIAHSAFLFSLVT